MDDKVKAYLETLPTTSAEKLLRLRDLIMKIIPHAKEKMGYGIPSYYLKHPIIHIAAFKHHIGIYPGNEAIEYFKEDILPYKTSEGTIRIPLDEPLPLELVEKLVRYNIAKE